VGANPLKVLRENAGMSQVEISLATGISTSRTSLFENGLGRLTLKESEAVRAAIIRAANVRHAAVLELAEAR